MSELTHDMDRAYLALLVACGAADDEVDGIFDAVAGSAFPTSPSRAVAHARDAITTYRSAKWRETHDAG